MFFCASSFNQPLDLWNISNVEDMSDMFNGASSFNQSLNKWNIYQVGEKLYRSKDISDMLENTSSFDCRNAQWYD